MFNDKIYLVWLSKYSKWWIDYLEVELKNDNFEPTTENLITIFNVIQFDELEKYLFYKYWVEFAEVCKNLLLNNK